MVNEIITVQRIAKNALGTSDQRLRLRQDGSLIASAAARRAFAAGYGDFRPAAGAGSRFPGRLVVCVWSDRSAADRVGRVVSALDSGQYGVFGGSANETALD